MKVSPMVSMELSEDESHDAYMPIPMSEKPKYPFGLKICLTNAELDKLGIDPAEAFVGGIFHLHALAEITCVSCNEMEDSEKQYRVEATLTAMAVESEDAENDSAEVVMQKRRKMYDRSMAND